MTLLQLQKIIQQGESITTEFKTCKTQLNKDAFESICAFLNRSGGHLILGINDDKKIVGVDSTMIARFFKEIGWVDELESGVRNTFKFCELYTPETFPVYIEGDVFKTIIPLDKRTTQDTTQMTTQVTTQIVADTILDLLLKNPTLSRKELAELIENITEDGVKYHLEKLKQEGRIERVGTTRGEWIVKIKNKNYINSQINTTQITTQMATQMTTQIVTDTILDLLQKNSTLSRKELAELIGNITEDGVNYHLDKLKQEGRIERVGSTRGEWKIIKKRQK